MGTLPATFDSVKEESKTPVEFPTDLLSISASNVTSKKIKARKLSPGEILQVYCRRAKRPQHLRDRPSFFEALSKKIDPESAVTLITDDEGDCDLMPPKKQKVDIDKSVFSRTRLRACGKQGKVNGVCSGSAPARRWTEAIIDDVDPCSLIGLDCKVFWPMDKVWYKGSIKGYDAKRGLHKIIYKDGDVEELNIGQEQVSFYVSRIEIRDLKLKLKAEKEAVVNDEMIIMAVGLNDSGDLDPGDVIWAKLTGHAAWPAIVVDESSIGNTRILKSIQGDKGVVVQFFGTYDFARVRPQKTVPFMRGTASGYHLKCKQSRFIQGLDEAQMYICKHKLPDEMLKLLKTANSSNSDTKSKKNSLFDEENQKKIKPSFPLEIGDLSVLSLGNIVQDSKYFQSRKCIFPEGYTAMRKFFSINDPQSKISYKMEVFRNPKAKSRPLFRVTLEDGGRVEGSTPDACWREIFSRIKRKLNKIRGMVIGEDKFQRTGSQMFGFLNKKVSRLIKALAGGEKFNEISGLPAGYRPIVLSQRDIDRCDVCHMDEEYEDNLFLQCDTCRITVHTRCYGELQPKDGSLWHCLLCRPPTQPSAVCCLCPVTGGAMKPTTDGRWAHLACAIWIPETCLLDVKKMEPIDGLSRINKDRWKLLCSICGVPYGACIQCSSNSCRVAYHPLCARSNGFCIEPEDVDQPHLMSSEEDDGQIISLLSFCRRHRQPLKKDQTISSEPCSAYVPPANPSGCARCEPYNFFGRRGQREPQVLSAASIKRSFIENTPYLVGGYRQNGLECRPAHFSTGANMNALLADSITSISEKYVHMRATFRKRLTFGKSRIHGFGVFAKLGHKAGDMVIEYSGEIVRPQIADLRENRIYNSLVGTGSYMFRADDSRVIDATKAGSIAQLINHSCEPNCYSRLIRADGDDRIIIHAMRDINAWEELTYDYRFSSIDGRLECHCGSSNCRGVVNDIDSEARDSAIAVHRSELIPCNGE